MNDLQSAFNSLLSILNHPFYVLGVRLTLTGIIIGCALVSLVGYFIFGLFDE